MVMADRSHSSFLAQPLTHAHERLAEFVHPDPSAISPERVARLDVDELGGERAKEQDAQVAVLAELEVQHVVHLNIYHPQLIDQRSVKERPLRRNTPWRDKGKQKDSRC